MERNKEFFDERITSILQSGETPRDAWIANGLDGDEFDQLAESATEKFGLVLGGWILTGIVLGNVLETTRVA